MSHFIYSPSSAKKWLTCSASIVQGYTKLPPDFDSSSPASELGAAAHEIAATSLEKFKKGETYGIPDTINGCGGCARSISVYVDHSKTLAHRWDAVPMIETPVNLFYKPKETGTLDFAVLTKNRIIIHDLKFGAGVPVYVENNPQLKIYAASYLTEHDEILSLPDDFVVEMWITQPRLGIGDPQSWETTWGDLKIFMEEVKRVGADIDHDIALNKSYTEVGPHDAVIDRTRFYPNRDACQFCDLKSSCPALREKRLHGVKAIFPNTPTEEDQFYKFLLEHQVYIKDALKKAEEHLLTRLSHGALIPGVKLGRGRAGDRTWADMMGMEMELLNNPATTEIDLWEVPEPVRILKSPAQLEKELKEVMKGKEAKTLIENFTIRPQGKLKALLTSDENDDTVIDLAEELG